MPREFISIAHVICTAETTDALLCLFESGEKHWVPKSQLGEDSEVTEKGDEGTLSISEWLVKEKGLE